MHIILETFCNPLCFVSAARKGSNKFLFLILLSMPWLAVSKGHAQFTFATDNASSSAYSDGWASGDNGGSGFNAWSISIPGPNAGVFIGNPSNNGMGTTGIGTTAFGLFSSANNSGYANASRDFATSLQVGDSLSFHWAMNWDSSGGAKGFDLKTSTGANVFNVNNGGNQNITVGGVLANGNYGTSPMLVNVTRTTNGYDFSMTARNSGGTAYTTSLVTTSTIGRINLYEGNQGDNNANRNIYFNNFSISNSGVFNQGGTITNANTFSGSGNLSVGNNTALVMNGTGDNNYTGSTTISNGSSLNLAGSGTNNFASAISGSGGFVQSGAGKTILSGNNSSFTGKTTISAGTLTIDDDARLGTAPGSGVADQLTLSGGNNSGGSKLQTTTDVTLSQNRGVTLSGDGGVLDVTSGTLTYSGTVSGSGGLGKDGGGALQLGGANTYSGSTLFRAGTILVGNNQSLGSGTLMFSFADNSAKTLAAVGSEGRTLANAIQIYNNLTLGQVSGNTGSLNFAGNVALGNEAGVRILTMADGTAHTISGVIDGLRGIVKGGGGSLTLSGNNTFSGSNFLINGTTIVTANSGAGTGTQNLGETWGSDSATLALGGSGITMANAINVRAGSSGTKKIEAINATGTSALAGAMDLGANTTLAANSGGGLALTGTTLNFAANTTLTVTNSSSVSIVNQLITSGDALIAKRGSGTLTLANASNYGDMRYDLYGGTLEVGQVGNLGEASAFKANKIYFDGGKLRATGDIDFNSNNGITLGANGGTIDVDAGRTLGLRGYINDMNNTGVTLTKTGAGVLLLNRGTSYDLSGTTLRVAEGVLDTWNPTGNLSATTELGGSATTGTFRFTKSDGAVTTDRNFLVNSGGGKIDVAVDALTVSGSISGSGTFTKDGAGSLTLTGTNSLSGSTLVAGGRLVVDGTLSQSAVTVQSGATLGGSGTVSALTVASGGTLAAGNSPGELTVTGNVIWSGGGSYDWEINSFPGLAGTNWDFLDIGGSLTIDATAGNRFIIDVISLLANNTGGNATGFDAFTNYSFAIATAAGGIGAFDSSWFNVQAGNFTNSMNPAGATAAGSWGVARSGNSILLNYTAAMANASAIPEPSSASLILLGLAGVALGRRFRR